MIEGDEIKENNEKFKLILHSPVNIIIGKKGKTTVKIINAVNGKFFQTFYGIVSLVFVVGLNRSANYNICQRRVAYSEIYTSTFGVGCA